jgi:hypothetical protein
MPQPDDVTRIASNAAGRLASVWEAVKAAEQALTDAVRAGRKAPLPRLLRVLRAAAADAQTTAASVGEDLARRGVPAAYAFGAQDAGAGAGFRWDQAHIDAVTGLSQDTYDDLLRASQEVGRTSARLARLVREAAQRLASDVEAGRTATDIGRQLAADLEEAGVSAITYRDGSRHGLREYGDVVARAKTAVAYNTGALQQTQRAGVGWVEVFDGIGCGVRSHTDPEKAAGQVWDLDTAGRYPISHPRCQRSFGGRPDVTSAEQASTVLPSTTAAQRADQAAVEQARRDAADRRAAVRRRQAALARRQQRVGTAT